MNSLEMLAFNPCGVSHGRPPSKSFTGTASITLQSEKCLKSGASHNDNDNDDDGDVVGVANTSSSIVAKVRHLFPGGGASERVHTDMAKNVTQDAGGVPPDTLRNNPETCSTPAGTQSGRFAEHNSSPKPNQVDKRVRKLKKWRYRRRSSLDENIVASPLSKINQESDLKDREEILCGNTVVKTTLTPDTRRDIVGNGGKSLFGDGKSSKPAHTSFFNRGNNLLGSVRSSLRKLGYRPATKTSVEDLDPLLSTRLPPPEIDIVTTTVQEVNASLNLKLEDMNSNDSQDSGLGEDSDLGEASVVTSPRTPPPCTIPAPILRLATCSSSMGSSKKHVVILEPNKIDLPSVRRQLHRQSMPPRLETVRIRAPILPEDTHLLTETNSSAGDVSGQWNQICESAEEEAVRVIKSLVTFSCDPTGCAFKPSEAIGYIFQAKNPKVMQRNLENLDSDSVCLVIYTVYRLLFYDWISHANKMVVSIIVHCVQRFLVVVVQICHDLEGISRAKLLKNFQQLLSSSEESRYADLRSCLYCTRTLYIDLWCSLLEVKKNLSECSEQWI